MRSSWTPEQAHRHREALLRELGPVIVHALEDPEITEVLLNPDGGLWLDSTRHGLIVSGERMLPDQARALLATVAGLLDRVISEQEPILEAELPLDGSRIEGVLPPVAEAPLFAIRKHSRRVIPLERYVEDGSVTLQQAEVLKQAVAERRNVLISGGPGSGKTTFANALLQRMSEHRVLVLEDTFELHSELPQHVFLHTSEQVDLRRLVRVALRLRPDRLVVGEVRGAEAHDLLKAWNTGNPGGLATLHANSATEALERLDQLVQEAGVPAQTRLIAASVHLVAHLERRTSGQGEGTRRVLSELVSVQGFDPERGFLTKPLLPLTPH